jgi:threonine aldolase
MSASPETHTLTDLQAMGRDTLREVNATSKRYLAIAATASRDVPNRHMSEYVGPQMLGTTTRAVMDRYAELLASGEINAQHGYDEDELTQTVVSELRKRTGAEGIILTLTGTAANLDLIASFVSATPAHERPDLQFVACETEHTLVHEGDMLAKAGIEAENMVLLPSRDKGDGFIDPIALAQALEKLQPGFIFQMAVPSNEGVVPPLAEFRAMVELVKSHRGRFLLDGARLANALAYWDLELEDLKKLGIDGFTLGTSKKGGLAEVVGIFDPAAAQLLHHEAKSFGHISSKTAPLALVTGVFLNTNLWKAEASSENAQAQAFAQALHEMGITPHFEVCSNMVFIQLPSEVLQALEAHPEFGVVYSDYGPDENVSRIVFTGFQPPEAIDQMVEVLTDVIHRDELANVTAKLRDLVAHQRNSG